MKRITCAVLLLAIAGCGTSTVAAGHTAAPSSPASSTASPAPAHSATPVVIDGNITLAPTSDGTGPFKITPLYCGKLTTAEQNIFGTTAAGGFIYRYTNDSETVTGSPDLTVNFLTGASITGSNSTGDQTAIGPGQNAEAEVDALSNGGGDISFSRCELMSYTVVSNQGDLPLTFAP